ncbi:hypothetical protein [Dyella sp. RRB7]|uniref:hypothetical protein n=1 Tax=Dyella sp. RRB7 TaxID=2919502 RepID=UPI001FA9A83F|nr:hypothetical protein [Dyella sp. RRB7]
MTELDLIIKELQEEMEFSRDIQRQTAQDREIQLGFQMTAILERLHARRDAMQRQGEESAGGKGGSTKLTPNPRSLSK